MPKTYNLNENGFREDESYDLEKLIDRKGIHAVLSEIVAIGYAKSAYVLHHWQDDPLGNAWARLAKRIDDNVVHLAEGM